MPAIDSAVKAGIPVYTFNSETEKESQRTAFVGQDLYNAGVLVGETLADLMGGEGQVGIITGYYNVHAHELRRQGIEEALGKVEGIEIVGDVENHDSGDEAYTATKNFITANPDIKGIAVTAGNRTVRQKPSKSLACRIRSLWYVLIPQMKSYLI